MKLKIKNLSKKNIILLITTIVLIILLGGTIAYFGWTSTEENKDSLVDVTLVSGQGTCDKLTDNNKLLVPTNARENGRVITLKVSQEVSSYAVIAWDMIINRLNTTQTTTDGLRSKYFKYELINTTTNTSYGSGTFENVTDGSTITLSSNEKLQMKKEYTFTLYLWIDGELGLNPADMQKQTYDIDMNCAITGTEAPPPSAGTTMTNLYTTASKITATNNGITYNLAPSVSLMNDRLGGTTTDLDGGNLRYYGADPNNYIYFNCSDYSNQSADTCEVWRIIGVFDGKLKLIRGSSIGKYSWDNKNSSTGAESDNGKNDWTTARLMKLLNPSDYYTTDVNDNGLGQSLYYTNALGKCYSDGNNATVDCDFTSTGIKNDITRNLISTTTYYLGGYNSKSIYSNEIYAYERGTNVYTGRPTTWQGKIALAYPSDFSYAADLGKCTTRLESYYNCGSKNWMSRVANNKDMWLLTTNPNTSYSAWGITIGGNITSTGFSIGSCNIFPTLYLNEDVGIKAGDGSSTNPYELDV